MARSGCINFVSFSIRYSVFSVMLSWVKQYFGQLITVHESFSKEIIKDSINSRTYAEYVQYILSTPRRYQLSHLFQSLIFRAIRSILHCQVALHVLICQMPNRTRNWRHEIYLMNLLPIVNHFIAQLLDRFSCMVYVRYLCRTVNITMLSACKAVAKSESDIQALQVTLIKRSFHLMDSHNAPVSYVLLRKNRRTAAPQQGSTCRPSAFWLWHLTIFLFPVG